MHKIFHKRRFPIFLILSIIAYSGGMYTLFIKFNILTSIVYFLIFFVSFHFLYIDIYNKYPRKYAIRTIIIITLGQIPLLGHGNIEIICGIIFINGSILLLANSLHNETAGTNKFSGTAYFRAGGYYFTMGITIAYTITSLGMYNRFPFNCNELSNASNTIIDTLTKPLKLGREQVQNLKETTTKIFSTTVHDAVTASQSIQIQSTTPQTNTLIDNIKLRKQELITKTITENKAINQGVCDYTLNIINQKLMSAGFQISIILSITVLIYPFLRIVTQAMSIIGVLIFELLFLCGVYRKEKVQKEIESIG